MDSYSRENLIQKEIQKSDGRFAKKNPSCRTFAVVALEGQEAVPVLLRSYLHHESKRENQDSMSMASIWDVCRATMGVPPLFSQVNMVSRAVTPHNHMNPTELAYQEAHTIWKNCQFRVVSIGGGTFPEKLWNYHSMLCSSYSEAREVHGRMKDTLASSKLEDQYFRLNVESVGAGFDKWDKDNVTNVRKLTKAYEESGIVASCRLTITSR